MYSLVFSDVQLNFNINDDHVLIKLLSSYEDVMIYNDANIVHVEALRWLNERINLIVKKTSKVLTGIERIKE